MGVQVLAHTDVSRGDLMGDIHKCAEGNIVKTYNFGNSTIHICDDYVVKNEQEIEDILQKFHEVGWKIFLSKEKP